MRAITANSSPRPGIPAAAVRRARSADRPPGALVPAEPLPDSDLVVLARSDPDAFAVLYERYFGAVFGYCWRRLDDRTVAEDACANVFSRAWAALPRCERPDRFRAWLFTIAHHEVTDRYRERRPVAPLDDVAWALPDPARSPEDQAIASADGDAVRAALDDLPPDQRHVVELKLAGLNGPEIAVVLGRQHGAVRALQHRAFVRLRHLLADHAPDRPDPPGPRTEPATQQPTDDRGGSR